MSDDSLPGRKGRSAEDVATIGWDPDESPHRTRMARLFRVIGRDPRTCATLAGLGAVAAFAALVGDWIIVTPPYEGPDGGPAELRRGVSDLGNYGGGYLIGTFVLVGCLALVLFGSPGVRHNARMVGLAIGAATGGVLLATTMTMQNMSRLYFDPGEGIDTVAGQGLVMGYVSTAALAAALLLAAPLRRPVSATGPLPPATDAAEVAAAGTPAGADPALAGLSWRRPREDRPGSDREDGLPPPADLTVTPAPPFTRPETPYTGRPETPYSRPETPDGRWEPGDRR